MLEISRISNLRFLYPQMYFPLLKPREDSPVCSTIEFHVDSIPTLYSPGILKHTDSLMLAQGIRGWFKSLGLEFTKDAVLDAHFGYPEGAACWEIAKKFDKPFFITLRGSELDLLASTKLRRKALIDALSNATGVISVSQNLKDAHVEACIPEDKITVIRNGVDTDLFCRKEKASCRAALEISEKRPVLVSVGNVVEVKRHDVLIKAVGGLHRKGIDAMLYIIGRKPDLKYLERLQKIIDREGIHNSVHFLGALSPDNLIDWLSAADVFALASRREGCCNAVLEALAVGLPTVVTDVGDNSFFVKPGVNGFLAPVEDFETMSDLLSSAFSRTWNATEIASGMRHHSWSGVASQVVSYMQSRI
jgi:teichuronic acid biosynthesis glycosyltransferase TuaC